MPFFRATEGDRVVAEFQVNGQHAVTYRNVVIPPPLITKPLRQRALNPAKFAGPKLKLERARSLLGDAYAIVQAYIDSQPLELGRRSTPDGGRVATVRMKHALPSALSGVVGDMVHNLRSSLDIMVCDLVRENGNVPTRNNSYPTSSQGFQNQTAGVGQHAGKFLARLRTSNRWNEAIWILHQLDLLDKHNTVLAVAGATVNIHATVGMPMLSWGPTPEAARPFPGVVGAPVGIRNVFLSDQETDVYRLNSMVEEQIRIRVTPVFAPGLPAEGEPIMDMLQMFGGVVERTIVLAERRLV